MKVKIIKVHRAGRVYYAADVAGVYIERTTLAELCEAIKVRSNFAEIFGGAK